MHCAVLLIFASRRRDTELAASEHSALEREAALRRQHLAEEAEHAIEEQRRLAIEAFNQREIQLQVRLLSLSLPSAFR